MRALCTTVERSPGWYENPDDPGTERFWTGSAWAGQARPAARWPAPVAPEPSLRDLLAAKPATDRTLSTSPLDAVKPATSVEGKNTRKTRRTRWLIGVVVVLAIIAVPGAYYGMRYDQYKRQTEIDSMLELVEESEATMYEWLTQLEGFAKTIEAECAGSEERCAALLEDPYFNAEIENAAREAKIALEATADQFTKSNGLSILAWHNDVIRARDSYLDHNAAWVKHLAAIERNIEEAFIDGASNDDIGPTFAVTCRHLERLKSSGMYPLMTKNNQARVDKICAE